MPLGMGMEQVLRKVLLVSCLLLVPPVYADSFLLTWTATGDDGREGSAAEYDLRCSADLIGEHNWDQAQRVTGLSDPQPAGSLEAFMVDGLDPDETYFFAIKVADEAGNWSTLSNVAIRPVCREVCIGMRGNVDGDALDRIDMADLVYLVRYAMGAPRGPAPRCPEEADVDGSGAINIADLVYLSRYTMGTTGEPAPVACW